MWHGGPTAYDALTIVSSALGPCGISISIYNTEDYASVSWDQTGSRQDGLMLRPPCCRLPADDDNSKPLMYCPPIFGILICKPKDQHCCTLDRSPLGTKSAFLAAVTHDLNRSNEMLVFM